MGVDDQVHGALAVQNNFARAVPRHRPKAHRFKHLAERLRQPYPALFVTVGSNDPAGFDLVVNATPMGMNAGDAMPMDISRIDSDAFVGEVVMKTEMTAFLTAAQTQGCRVQIGTDMLFEQIPAYLEFFGFPSTTPDVLRSVAQLSY